MKRETLVLTKPWGPHEAGEALRVLRPGEALGPGKIDPQRAEQLERDGYTEPPEKPKPTRRRKAKEE